MNEDGGMRWSSRGDEAEEKQRSSDEEEPEEMQSRGDQGVAEQKQPRADEDKESPGLDHPGQKKKEQHKRNDHKRRRKETGHPPDGSIRGGTSSRGRHPPGWIICGQVAAKRPGLDRPGRAKQQAPPRL